MKKRWMYILTSAVAVFMTAFMIASCSDDEKNARVEVRLTDAPGNYDAVNIEILDVEVHSDGGGWSSLNIIPGNYNLLKLTNGLDTLLGSIDLPAGRVSQIRLVLGNNNTVTVDGQTKDLITPSAQQSGLKLNVQADLTPGITYKFLLDFDVARSIVVRGNGTYSLKPVIRAITEATSGAIKGMVSLPESTPAVYAIIDPDTLGTTFADSTGAFFIRGLPAGLYRVSFAPATGYTIEDKTSVPVTLGNVTDVGVVVATH
jgi:hypothetical protein